MLPFWLKLEFKIFARLLASGSPNSAVRTVPPKKSEPDFFGESFSANRRGHWRLRFF